MRPGSATGGLRRRAETRRGGRRAHRAPARPLRAGARLNEIVGGLGLGLTNDVGRDPAEERLRLKTWPELGHVFTDRMQDDVFAWLDAVL
ncbi:hypothetical protein SSP24_19480 [Streptomyces spinoverrucosus]|uniref:Uncharacterized protein n=1 Tax=Streptomyces spinoverrucosus TaxID=284043 RepID=A0A4Y3VCZ3_9ACTN|nr:hypothetical protein SSP24_19480 [Streptomyces spinoverrucosus]GHB47523.1 hypothetical protein GCM10010397_16940 [Streptomyces spinoverrucosus]